ncbi:MAG: hypothetical protein ACT4P8_14875 [Betaproteobacteria bacterium]
MSERVIAWQCIGCGRIEGAQPCIGICQDRKVEFVYASKYEEALTELRRMQREVQILAAVARQLAHTTPREGEWERSYRALQDCARRALERPDVQESLRSRAPQPA